MPQDLADQIAAGEVVERPASAVKELVENALDAGATRIQVDIEDGGLALIRVRDDGHGMRAEDATLAMQRHASSKLLHAGQLFAIQTLGFRGEALPSIASVSRLRLVTRTADVMGGVCLEVEGGDTPRVRSVPAPPGTEVTVRDLFYNTPARLKFLRTPTTEFRAITEVMQRMAMVHPQVGFRLTHQGRPVMDLPPVADMRARLHGLLGREEAIRLHPIEPHRYEAVTASGWLGSPELHRRTAGHIWCFVNRRYVRDRGLLQAIRVGWEGLLDRGRYPVTVLLIEVPTHAVDVNVHPAKLEVRFHQADDVYRATRRAIRETLARSPWRPEAPAPPSLRLEPLSIPPPSPTQQPLPASALWSAPPTRTYVLRDRVGTLSPPGEPPRPASASAPGTEERPDIRAMKTESSIPGEGFFSALQYIGTFRANYLLASTGDDLVVVDQHAAHERITYEALRRAWQERRTQSEQLLVPRMLSLSATRASTFEAHADWFDSLGWTLESLGDGDVALHAVPAILRGADHAALLEDALDELMEHGSSHRLDEAVEHVLIRMACHGSVRSGQRLAVEQVRDLFLALDGVDFGANCPHGRPVWFRMTHAELETRFERR
jgi:DNA mismatch repair protein MutL